MSGKEELPSTLRRSPRHAQEVWSKAHDSAVETYGEGRRAHQTAFAALKHQFEKVGDHWEPKGRRGPSDERARETGPSDDSSARTAGGVDANATKAHLYGLARKLDIAGRSRMDKGELIEAIKRENAARTRSAR